MRQVPPEQALNRKEDAPMWYGSGRRHTAALGILPAAIGRFHQQQKSTSLRVATMNNTMLLAGLKSGEIDRVRGRMSDQVGGFKLRTAVLESLKLVVRPGHPVTGNVTLSRVMGGR